MNMNRRDFVKMAAAGTALPLTVRAAERGPMDRPKFHLFSKCFMMMGIDELAAFAAQRGFDGIEWAVRDGGHILPERAKTDLPKAIEACRKQGLVSQMIVTGIQGPESPYAEEILKTARDGGVKVYRTGYLAYENDLPFTEGLDRIRRKFAALETLSRTCGVTAGYQNHFSFSESHFGGAVWDLAEVLEKFDPQWVSSQYDATHGVVESGNAWRHPLGRIAPYVRSLCLKDFFWMTDPKNPRRKTFSSVPVGEGIVPWKEVAGEFRRYRFSVPMSVHCDYYPPPAVPLSREKLTETVQRELRFFKDMLS